MKNLSFTILSILFLTNGVLSQQEIDLMPDGIVIPRTTPAAVGSPVMGQIIYNTDSDSYAYYDGATWIRVGTKANPILDDDGDTGIELFEHPAGDYVRIKISGIETFNFSRTGLSIINNSENVFINGGGANTTGDANTFVGFASGALNTTGSSNTFLGKFSGALNTTGSSNTFIGRDAGQSNTASNNAFVGYCAGFGNTTGSENSFFGHNTGFSNTTGINNSFFGEGAGESNTTASQNSFFGQNAGNANTVGTQNSFFGQNAGSANTGSHNSFFGTETGRDNTTGTHNSFFGRKAGVVNTTGSYNVFLGQNAGFVNSTGEKNTYVGTFSGSQNITGSSNVFIGHNAGTNETGSERLYIANDFDNEDNALIYGEFDNRILKFNGNIAIQPGGTSEEEGLFIKGKPTVDEVIIQLENADTGGRLYSIISTGGTDVSGQGNFIIKDETGSSNRLIIDNSGDVGIGTNSPSSKLEINGDLTITTDGSDNSEGIIISGDATTNKVYLEMHNNDTGGVNYSLNSSGGTAGAGQGKWFIRDEDAGANRLLIDNTGDIGVGTDTPSHILHISGIGRSTQSTWDTSSDKRAKENIADIENAGHLLKQFRPVRFDWKKEYRHEVANREYGFIAQEVEQVIPQMVQHVEEMVGEEMIPDFRVLNTSSLTPLLVKGYQELAAENDELREEVSELKVMILELMNRMSEE